MLPAVPMQTGECLRIALGKKKVLKLNCAIWDFDREEITQEFFGETCGLINDMIAQFLYRCDYFEDLKLVQEENIKLADRIFYLCFFPCYLYFKAYSLKRRAVLAGAKYIRIMNEVCQYYNTGHLKPFHIKARAKVDVKQHTEIVHLSKGQGPSRVDKEYSIVVEFIRTKAPNLKQLPYSDTTDAGIFSLGFHPFEEDSDSEEEDEGEERG